MRRSAATPRSASARVRRGAAGLVALALAATLATPQCFRATQVTVHLTTTLPCGERLPRVVAVYAGPKERSGVVQGNELAPQARTEACSSASPENEIGTIALVPTGDRGATVGVTVAMGVGGTTPESCIQGGAKGCIVARRRVAYVKGQSLTLPISLRESCLDVLCDENTTCVNGACQPADLANAGFCTEETCEAGAPRDAGVGAPDAAPDAPAGECVWPQTGEKTLPLDRPVAGQLAATATTIAYVSVAPHAAIVVPRAGGGPKALEPVNVLTKAAAALDDTHYYYVDGTQGIVRDLRSDSGFVLGQDLEGFAIGGGALFAVSSAAPRRLLSFARPVAQGAVGFEVVQWLTRGNASTFTAGDAWVYEALGGGVQCVRHSGTDPGTVGVPGTTIEFLVASPRTLWVVSRNTVGGAHKLSFFDANCRGYTDPQLVSPTIGALAAAGDDAYYLDGAVGAPGGPILRYTRDVPGKAGELAVLDGVQALAVSGECLVVATRDAQSKGALVLLPR